MKIYKYRNLSGADEKTLERLCQTILQNSFWCANLESLNDKDEFKFKCNCTPTDSTELLLAELMKKMRNHPNEVASWVAKTAMKDLEPTATPIINEMIDNCRNECGLACFSIAKNNNFLWEHYGGNGNGLCIEVAVPNNTENLFPVNYVFEKVIHIDTLIGSIFRNDKAENIYKDMLLTKTLEWQREEEIRFVTKKPNVWMHINGSVITEIIFGNKIEPDILGRIRAAINSNPTANSIKLTQMK